MTKIELFDDLESPIFAEWKDMPEFVQEKQEPFAKIIVRFDSQEALDEFALLIGQKLTKKTKSIWHPQLIRGLNADKRYVDES
jgi:hypothetical protein